MFDERSILCLCDFETTGLNEEKNFPIEIGFIITDHNFNKLTEYSSLIKWPDSDLYEFIDTNKNKKYFKRGHIFAKNVHNIDYSEIEEKGKYPTQVLADMLNIFKKFKPKYGKVILASDNIVFEWKYMKVLLGADIKIEEIFHYAPWDTSMYLEFTKVGDPKNIPHRALEDVKVLYEHVLRSKKIIDSALANEEEEKEKKKKLKLQQMNQQWQSSNI